MSLLDMIFILLLPLSFIILGFMMSKKPLKRNLYIGWRTHAAMKNEVAFRYANQHGGKGMLSIGMVEFLCTMLYILLVGYQREDNIVALWIVLLQFLVFVFLIAYVEWKLRRL